MVHPNFMAKAPIKPRIQERFMEIYESISPQAE
jgi:hypothetical protein